jgi:hypothetical protein
MNVVSIYSRDFLWFGFVLNWRSWLESWKSPLRFEYEH